MSYTPKIVLGKVDASKVTDKNVGDGCVTKKDIDVCKEFINKINGLELKVSLWDYDNYSKYHLWSWKNKDDETMKEAFWLLENQFGFLERDKFIKEWKAREYDAGGSTVIPLECIQVIEVLQEEVKE